MSKKLWLAKRENAAWQSLWKTLLAQGVLKSEALKTSWRDISTSENRWLNLAHRWLIGEFGITRETLLGQFTVTFGDIAECNIKILEWGRVAEALKEYRTSLN